MRPFIKKATGWFRTSLFPQLIAPIVLMAAAVLLVCVVTSNLFFSGAMIQSFRASEQNYLAMQAGNIETLLARYSNQLYGAAVDRELLSLTRRLSGSDALRRSEAELAAREYLESAISFSDISAATLALTDGGFIAYTRLQDTQNWPSWFSSNSREGYNDALRDLCDRAQATGRAVLGTVPQRYSRSDARLIHLACPVVDLYTRVSYGTLVFSVNTARLCATVNPDDATDRYAQGVLTTADGTVIAHIDPDMTYRQLSLADGASYAGSAGGMLPDEPLVLCRDLNRMGFVLYRVVDQGQLRQIVRSYVLRLSLVIGAILALLLAVITVLLRRVMRSVRALLQGINAASQGDLAVRVPVTDAMEIGQITGAFNHMAGQLSQARQRAAEQSRLALDALDRQRVAEIRVLENQINSHFLYNTLNTINYTAMESGSLNTSRQIKHLANMLRYTFQDSEAVVSAAQEGEWLEEYLALQKLRFGKRFDYTVTVDPKVAEWPMRKLIVQPFVENSVLHGFEGCGSGGQLSVSFRPHGDGRMRVTVRDNGCGMSPAQLAELQARFADPARPSDSGIGLENARQRLLSYYGGGAKVTLRSWQGQGTAIVLLLPPFAPAATGRGEGETV